MVAPQSQRPTLADRLAIAAVYAVVVAIFVGIIATTALIQGMPS
jgi:hypothetical protein